MKNRELDDTPLRVAEAGAGETLVLVHGSWTDGTCWDAVVPLLGTDFRVVTYDRRGHSGSRAAGRPDVTRRDHEDDLIALIEGLAAGPVHVVGSSFGGSISLAVAGRRPDLVRSVTVHEPPLLGLAEGTPLEAAARGAIAVAAGIVADVESGQVERGTAGSSRRSRSAPAGGSCSPRRCGIATSPTRRRSPSRWRTRSRCSSTWRP